MSLSRSTSHDLDANNMKLFTGNANPELAQKVARLPMARFKLKFMKVFAVKMFSSFKALVPRLIKMPWNFLLCSMLLKELQRLP